MQAQQLLDDHDKRGNVPLKETIALDDRDRKNLHKMRKGTRAYIKTECWNKVRDWVDEHWK